MKMIFNYIILLHKKVIKSVCSSVRIIAQYHYHIILLQHLTLHEYYIIALYFTILLYSLIVYGRTSTRWALLIHARSFQRSHAPQTAWHVLGGLESLLHDFVVSVWLLKRYTSSLAARSAPPLSINLGCQPT